MTQVVKKSYRVTNWAKYNDSLVSRGSITFWFDEEMLAVWQHKNEATKRGRPFVYSNQAMECLLVLRELFQLPYRQTEGLARSLMQLMKVAVPIPDYSSLAKRAPHVAIPRAVSLRPGAIDIVVDSTGLKVFGEGEWKVRKHGPGKHRTWRKLHLAINPQTHEIEAEVLTENNCIDATPVPELLAAIPGPIRSLCGDAAYDKWLVYDALELRGIEPIIPPQHNAKLSRGYRTGNAPRKRDLTILRIRSVGSRQWKTEVGYHRRSLAETTMQRMKTVFGGELKNRLLENQKAEVRVRCRILNHHTQLGLPPSRWD